MGEYLIQSILPHIPDTWQEGNGDYNGFFTVSIYSGEFDEVESRILENFSTDHQEVNSVRRVQNVIFYGQFLCREDYLSKGNGSTFYIVRRFVTILKSQLSAALKYNLDPRRFDVDALQFSSSLDYVEDDEVVLVVLVLTNCPYDNLIPNCSSNYYIEYAVTFD